MFQSLFIRQILVTSRKSALTVIFLIHLFYSPFEANARSKITEIPSPIAEKLLALDGTQLIMKHYAQNPALHRPPLLLIPGLAQNDRFFDSQFEDANVAHFFYQQGYDVWIANFRNSGTPGFRSSVPEGPYHYTVDDYAIKDLPLIIQRVYQQTGQPLYILAHSMGAWVLEGTLSGMTYLEDNESKNVSFSSYKAKNIAQKIKAVASISGIYNVKWKKSFQHALSNPIQSEDDYYHSNYELELLSSIEPLYWIGGKLPALPLNWVGFLFQPDVSAIPILGDLYHQHIEKYYRSLQNTLALQPIFNMLYYRKNCHPDMVRLHAYDSLEDFGPHVIQQFANTIRHRKTMSYFAGEQPTESVIQYSTQRKNLSVPYFFIGAEKDRMASAIQVYEDGYLEYGRNILGKVDKKYLSVENFGHLDIATGMNAPQEVWIPILSWFRSY